MKENHACRWCRGELSSYYKSNSSGFVNVPLSSAFARSVNERRLNTHSFEFTRCNCCYLPQITSTSSHKNLGHINSLIKYNEPKNHHCDLVKLLENHVPHKVSKKIALASGKDLDVANHLCSSFSSVSYLSENDVNKYDIVLANRYLEHCNHSEEIHKVFKSCSNNGLLVIECLDFDKMYNLNHNSYLWDERLSYFSWNYILHYANLFGYEGFWFKEYKNNDEPFWVGILLRTKIVEPTVDYSLLSCENMTISFQSTLDHMKESFIDLYQKGFRNFSFIGIGHKAQFASHVLLNTINTVSIKYFDSSSVKLGTLWNGSRILPFSELSTHHIAQCKTIYIFSFGGSNAELLRDQISFYDPMASYCKINQLYGV